MRQSFLIAAAAGFAMAGGLSARTFLRNRGHSDGRVDAPLPENVPESDVWHSISDDVEPTLMQDPLAVQRSRRIARSRADID